MAKLIDILNEMLQGRLNYAELAGGLRLQFKQAADAEPSKLLCYRIEVDPGTIELVTMRQHLEKLLPAGTDLVLEKLFVYQGADGLARHCRVFLWQAVFVQSAMLLPVEVVVRDANNYVD